MNYKISIIVPVYNAESTIKRCIESLQCQTYDNIEIILVNDGSSDSSLDICQRYSILDERIKVINKKNGGVSSARNAGLEIVSGKLIMFCDSDDWVEPNWCQVLLLQYDPSCLFMSGVFVEGEQVFYPYKVHADSIAEKIDRIDFYKYKLQFFNVLWNKIYSKDIIYDNNIHFSENISNGEDLLFNVQYLTYITGKIVFLNECTYHYVWTDENSLSSTIPDNYRTQCDYLFHQLKFEIEKLGKLKPEYRKIFYTDFFNQYQKYLLSLLKDNHKKIMKRWQEANSIMKSKEYQTCASNAVISSNKIYSYINRRQTCYLLWIVEEILRKRKED